MKNMINEIGESIAKGIEDANKAFKRNIPLPFAFDDDDMNICPVCGTYILTDDHFCSNCGQAVDISLNLNGEQFNDNKRDYDKDIKTLVQYHGEETTLDICMEEPAELIQAVSKYRRATNHAEQIERKENMTEEMADVLICFNMLCYMLDINPDEIESQMKRKMKRNIQRIGNV